MIDPLDAGRRGRKLRGAGFDEERSVSSRAEAADLSGTKIKRS
jgi:hypothetical protein